MILFNEDLDVADLSRDSQDRHERVRVIAAYRERLTTAEVADLFGDGELVPNTLQEVVEAMRDEHGLDASENCPGADEGCWVCHWLDVLARFAKAAQGSPLASVERRTPRELAALIKDMNRPWTVRNFAADELAERVERAERHG